MQLGLDQMPRFPFALFYATAIHMSKFYHKIEKISSLFFPRQFV